MEQMSDKKRKEITPFTSDFTDRLVIPASYSHFTICFASLTYNRPQQNKYAYRLQGFDADWHYVDASSRTAYYSKLPAGEYVFQLRATNENGDWGDVREMEIIIEPPFWATWWAYFIYVILEDFYNLLRHRRFGRKSKNEVMIWQPYLFLRFAVSCFHCHSS